MLWNGCSRSVGICVHDAPEYGGVRGVSPHPRPQALKTPRAPNQVGAQVRKREQVQEHRV
jgi:hypothetical protein